MIKKYALIFVAFLCFVASGFGQTTDLIISEYVEGSSSNKYIEIYNGTGVAVNLTNYRLQLFANGASTPTNDILLSGTLANGAVIVYENSAAAVYAGAATVNAAVNFNGDDAVALYKISTTSYVDIFGRIGSDPGSAWTATGYSTVNKTLVRKPNVCGGITVNPTGTGPTAFTTLSTEWDIYNQDDVSNLGSHTATCSSCTPPTDPVGAITGVTPACSTTDLNYAYDVSEPLAGIDYYWQTASNGTDTTDPVTSDLTVTTSGTYYVRAYDSALTCWSSGTVSYAVVINAPPTIDTQPTDLSVNEGDNAIFTVVSTDATGYTWEEYDGVSWSTIGTGATLTLTAVPISKDGYQYRVTLSNGQGCGTTVSDIVTLTVLTAACVDQGFNGFDPLLPSTHPLGWTFTTIGTYGTLYNNVATPSLQFNSSTDLIVTETFTNAIELSFWIKGQSINAASAFLVEGYDGGSWITVDNITNISNTGTTYTYNATSIPALPPNLQQFRFTYTKIGGNLAFDDVRIYCGTPISGNEINVTGNNAPIPDGSTSPSAGNNTNFGSTLIGNNIIKTFKIQNLGTTDLTLSLPITLSDISAPQEFTITQPSLSIIPAGGSTTFTVTFNSAVAGLFSNTINIDNNDSDENPYTFDIIATATNTPPAGTIYNPGELIFVGYDGQIYGAGSEDEYLIATMVDMVTGTKFSVVNSRYEAGAAAGVRTNKWGSGSDNAALQPYEAKITYNGAATIPAGSVLRFVTNSSPTWFGTVEKIVGTTTTNVTASFSGALTFAGGVPNISTSGSDQMYLMQGDFVFDGTTNAAEANYFLNGTLLHGLTNRSAWVPLTNACNGDASGGNTRESRLPSDLACFNVENISATAVSAYYENDKEHGLATLRQIILGVADVSNNWTLGTGRYTLDPTSTTSTTAGKTFLIGPGNPAGQWVGNVNTNWFNCANWEGLKVPDATTNVSVDASAINNAVINYLAPYSDDYSDLATCNDLIINGKKVVVEGNINNKLQVNGNLLIDAPSGVLDMDDSNPSTSDGELYLSGNWTNKIGTAAFEEGNGTVVFQGTGTQLINNYIPIPIRPTEEYYNVVLANDLNTSTSNDLYVNGNLTINTGKLLTVTADRYVHVDNNLTNDGTLNILNNGSLVQVKNTGVNTGNISMERTATIKRQDYVYWSSPVDGFNINNVSTGSPSNLIFKWDPVFSLNPNGGQGNWVAATGDTMAKGVGYIVRGPSSYDDTPAPYTAVFNNGVARNGIVDVPIYKGAYTGASGYAGNNGVTITRYDDNWNLIGNPYPSAINSLDFLNLNTNIDGFVYLWTHETLPDNSDPTGNDSFYQDFVYSYAPSDYIKYDGMGTVSGPTSFNGWIGAGQSFMVNMLDNAGVLSGETVRFQNSLRNRTYSNSQFFRTTSGSENPVTADAAIEKHRIWLDLLSDTNGSNRILVGYAEGATMERDRLFDAFTTIDNLQNFYSIIDDEPFDIQGRALPFNATDAIPLGLKIVTPGSYKIAIGAVDGLFETDAQAIYLKDNYLNLVYDLRSYPYSFTSEAGKFDNRFELVFQPETLSVNDNEISPNGLAIIELPDGRVKFTVGNSLEITSVQIIDMLGRMLYKLEGTSASEVYDLTNLSQAAYIAKVTLSNGQIITKRAVKRK